MSVLIGNAIKFGGVGSYSVCRAPVFALAVPAITTGFFVMYGYSVMIFICTFRLKRFTEGSSSARLTGRRSSTHISAMATQECARIAIIGDVVCVNR